MVREESSDTAALARMSQVSWSALWRLGGLTPFEFVRRVIQGYQLHQLNARSAQFAYYSMLGIAPLLLVIIACVAHLPLKGVTASFLNAVNAGLPEDAVQIIDNQIQDIQEHSTAGLIVAGFVLLAIAGSRIFLTLGQCFDVAYGVIHGRRLWKAYIVALLLTGGVVLLFLTSMVLLVLGPSAAKLLTNRVDIPWLQVLLSAGVRWGVSCGFLLVATSAIYCWVPSVKLTWRLLTPGSVVATAGWVVATQGLRLYAENFGRFNETYGALGGVVVLLVWLYLTGTLLLTGGEIDSVIYRASTGYRPRSEEPTPI